MKNIKGTRRGFDLNGLISPTGPLNDIDKDMLIKYSSKVDYVGNVSTVQGKYIATQELINFSDRALITIDACSPGCKCCVGSRANQCVECFEDFTLLFSEYKRRDAY